MTLFQIIKMLYTFGPDVVKLIGEVVSAINKANAGKDRRAAERALYIHAWSTNHGVPYPFDTRK